MTMTGWWAARISRETSSGDNEADGEPAEEEGWAAVTRA